MALQYINGKMFLEMVLAGAASLEKNVSVINALNVFPVPDGDTGTNMNMSFSTGVLEMQRHADGNLGEIAQHLSKGLLMGARGNSGVILSQLFRGFAKSVTGLSQVNAEQLAEAFNSGVQTAYQAVVKPVEGTILTVSKEASRQARLTAKKTDDVIEVMAQTLTKAREALAKTPDQLPVLKQVGVVDAGGQGLVFVYEGFLAALQGDRVDAADYGGVRQPAGPDIAAVKPAQAHLSAELIEHGYWTEFIVRLDDQKAEPTFSVSSFREQMEQFGDSLLVVADDDLVKIHIHAEYPGDVLNFAMKFGSLTKIKIDNMREQHAHIAADSEQFGVKPFGIVAVSMGDGISEIFKSIGVDIVIAGGQSMNPSTEEIVRAIGRVNAETVFVLPNNSNIILAAEQSRELADANVVVIPTKTIPQGFSAALSFNAEATAEANEEQMLAAARSVKSGQVTYAVRDSQFEGIDIREGDFIALLEGKIVLSGTDLIDTSRQLLSQMIQTGEELVTVFAGGEVEEEQVSRLTDEIFESYPEVELEVHQGGQPLYYFIFAVE